MNFAHNRHLEKLPDYLIQDDSTSGLWWQRQSLRFKTTVLAIAIGTIPTLAVGWVAYYFAVDSLTQQTSNLSKTLVGDLQDQVNIFIGDRLGDLQVMASLDIFTNPQLSKQATRAENSAALERIQDAAKIYDSIAVFDIQGNVIAQTKGEALNNHLDRDYVQNALKSQGAVITLRIG